MEQPKGFNDETGRVCRLTRSLYGLKQAPRCWNERVGKYLLSLGFVCSDEDPCLFIRERNQKKVFLALYVDDGLVATEDDVSAAELIDDLKREFKITSKPGDYFLGIEINRFDDGSIRISQGGYTDRLLEKFRMADCNPAPTPIISDDPNNNNNNQESSTENRFPYREAVGGLIYLMTSTRPDIAYAVGVVSRCLENPSNHDWAKVKRIFRYLKGTRNFGILYSPGNASESLFTYSDADFGGDHTTGRSTTGVVSTYAGGAISWLSQRQPSVMLATTGAEIVAASEAARDAIWLKRVLEELLQTDVPVVIQVDNEAAVRLARNPEYHRRTKHIAIRHFFVRECVTNGDMVIEKIPSEHQLADMLTKPLHGPRLKRLCAKIGLGAPQVLS